MNKVFTRIMMTSSATALCVAVAGTAAAQAVSTSETQSTQTTGAAAIDPTKPQAGPDSAPPTEQAAAASDGIEDIIVTAERREASVQRTAIAISAIGGDSLAKGQIVNVESLANKIPNVTFGRNSGNAKVFIRGIGLDAITPGSDSRVAIYTDSVYNARSQAAFLGFYDIDRIEVLAGPQGTLYGRNATAGAVNILTRNPTNHLEGYGTLTVGNYALIRAEGAISGPLSDTVSARLSFQTVNRDGYGKNIQSGADADDENSRAVRGKLQFEPSSDIKLLLSADYYKADDHNGGYLFLGNSPGNQATSIGLGFKYPTNRRDYAGQGPIQQMESWGTSLTGTFDLGGPKLTSITAYRRFSQDIATTSEGTTANYVPLFIRERAKQFTQELRLTHSIGPVSFLLGAYYFHEDNSAGLGAAFGLPLFGLPPFANTPLAKGVLYGGSQKTDAYAAFSQATIKVTDRLGIDLGLRYSDEKRSVNENTQFTLAVPFDPNASFFTPDPSIATFLKQKASWSSTDPKVTVHYQFNPTLFGYATYSKGFKSGGFNLGFLQSPFDPEKITDYEVGLKADLFNRRLRANIAGFWYDYKNLQVNVNEGLQLVTRNAGASKIYGLEGQFTALPTDDLRLNLNLSWLHSEYTSYITPDNSRPGQGSPGVFLNGAPAFDLRGNQLSYAPKYKVDGEIGYTFHTGAGDFTPRANVTWVDRIYFSQFNQPYSSQPARTQVDLFLDYQFGNSGWSGSAYVRNLTDDFYSVASTLSAQFIGLTVLGQVGPPRTYGLSITKRF